MKKMAELRAIFLNKEIAFSLKQSTPPTFNFYKWFSMIKIIGEFVRVKRFSIFV